VTSSLIEAGRPGPKNARFPPLLIHARTVDGCAVVVVAGELDIAGTGPLSTKLARLLSRGATRIVLDLSHLVFCDAMGVGTLIRFSARASACGGWLRLAAVQPQPARLLRITQLTRAFPAYPTVADALAGPAVRPPGGDSRLTARPNPRPLPEPDHPSAVVRVAG
jgi:anti-sigma B factor antagonist